MRVLVTGANGFTGQHLVAELQHAGHTPLLHGIPAPVPNPGATGTWHDTDLGDANGLMDLVESLRPEACIHLAGMAFVPAADANPALAFQINTLGTLNLLTAFQQHAPGARILAVTSSQVYGQVEGNTPIAEDHPLCPHNLYSATKTAADQVARLYAERFGMDVMTARPYNHIGPGQSPLFVSSAFSRQLIAISRGDTEPVIHVGNLESERDFLDVRDVARAYRLLIEGGQAGLAYNIATGNRLPIRTILDELCRLSDVHPERIVDPDLYRPTDYSAILDISRIQGHVHWTPRIPLEQTLRDILDDVRQRDG